MTVDELKVQIELSCGLCDEVSEGMVCAAVKGMKTGIGGNILNGLVTIAEGGKSNL